MHFITIISLSLSSSGNQADVLLPDVQKCLLFWNSMELWNQNIRNSFWVTLYSDIMWTGSSSSTFLVKQKVKNGILNTWRQPSVANYELHRLLSRLCLNQVPKLLELVDEGGYCTVPISVGINAQLLSMRNKGLND